MRILLEDVAPSAPPERGRFWPVGRCGKPTHWARRASRGDGQQSPSLDPGRKAARSVAPGEIRNRPSIEPDRRIALPTQARQLARRMRTSRPRLLWKGHFVRSCHLCAHFARRGARWLETHGPRPVLLRSLRLPLQARSKPTSIFYTTITCSSSLSYGIYVHICT